jgi:hypothetical protein
MTGRGIISDGDRGEPQALSGAKVAFGTWATVVVDDGSRSPKARECGDHSAAYEHDFWPGEERRRRCLKSYVVRGSNCRNRRGSPLVAGHRRWFHRFVPALSRQPVAHEDVIASAGAQF